MTWADVIDDDTPRPAHTYVRWRSDEPRVAGTIPPLDQHHPLRPARCVHPLCDDPLGNGSAVALLALGPHDDESAERHAAGRWYSALAVPAHARCVGADGEPR